MKMDSMVLSIIVPAYNVKKYILDLLDSIYNCGADEDKFELLIIDDGATDETIEVIKKSKYANYSNLRICMKENGGHGSCINYGVKILKGKYFRVIDGDDWINGDNFIQYLKTLEASNADLIIDSYSKFFVDTEKTETYSDIYNIAKLKSGSVDNLLPLLHDRYLLMPMITIKTEEYRSINKLIDEKISYDDAEFNAICIAAANTYELCNFNIYQYRIGREGQSVDISVAVKKMDDRMQVVYYVMDIISNISISKADYLERYISKTATYCIMLSIRAGKKSNKTYHDLMSFDNDIKKTNNNVYKYMENIVLNGKKMHLFRKYKRVFYYALYLNEKIKNITDRIG